MSLTYIVYFIKYSMYVILYYFGLLATTSYLICLQVFIEYRVSPYVVLRCELAMYFALNSDRNKESIDFTMICVL